MNTIITGVDIWLCHVHDAWDPWQPGLLPADEIARARRFRRPHDQRRHAITRLAVRQVLSRYAGVAPADWRFVIGAQGRPALAPDQVPSASLDFNISHTDALIAIAVAHQAVGIDVESLARPAVLEIADRFFSPAESQALAALAPARQPRAFYAYWTLKEAYVKARGMGLSLPLDRFGFDLGSADHIGVWMDPALGDDASRWWFGQWTLQDDVMLAVCAARADGSAPPITMRRLAPDGAVQPVGALREATSKALP